MKKVVDLFKSDIVFTISFILAIISTVVLRPSVNDLFKYIDFKTLTLLFVLMLAVKGLEDCLLFEAMAGFLLKRIKNVRSLFLALNGLCFLTAMFITNDVALITFVPFSIYLLYKTGFENQTIKCVVLMTISANMGSMLLPVGNPQNLYLFSLFNMNIVDFIVTMLPPYLMSMILILACIMFVKKENIVTDVERVECKNKTALHIVVFVVSLTCVLGFLPYYYLLIIALCVYCIVDRKLLLKVDYVLLLTFIFFFIFIGNLKNVEAVSTFMTSFISGREFITGLVSSQFISNVPAAILLSGFTDGARELLWGVDIGGLGTIIASMASLISYKLYLQSEYANGKKYMGTFTLYNGAFLAVMVCFTFVFI